MKPVLATIAIACALAAPAHAQLGPVPSWNLTQGASGTCSSPSGFNLPGVYINAPAPASEQGVLSAPGNPSLGSTQDDSYTGVGLTSFFVYSAGYTVPPQTLLTLQVTTYNGPNFTGGVAFVSTITWNCSTGALANARAAPVPALAHAALALLALTLLVVGTRSVRARARR